MLTLGHLLITGAVLFSVCIIVAALIGRTELDNINLRADYRGPDDPEGGQFV